MGGGGGGGGYHKTPERVQTKILVNWLLQGVLLKFSFGLFWQFLGKLCQFVKADFFSHFFIY